MAPLKEVSSVSEFVRHKGDQLLFESETYVDPSAWYRFDPASKRVVRTALYQTAAADLSDAEVVRECATSKDGTQVPVTIMYRKGTRLDGSNPAILYGYGGFNISETPFFSVRQVLLDHGIVYAVADLRGGGEYDEQ